MNLFPSFPVRPTAFKIAPFADHDTQFELKNAHTISSLNIPPANVFCLKLEAPPRQITRH